jgi:hypothetical protein
VVAGAEHRLDRAAASGRVLRVARPEHGDDQGAQAGRERQLHAGRSGQLERLRHVPGLAGQALHVLAGRGERDQRDEEDGDEPAAGPVPVPAVAAAPAAEEHALPERPVDDAQAPENEHVGPFGAR